jgi:hypothetical protein
MKWYTISWRRPPEQIGPLTAVLADLIQPRVLDRECPAGEDHRRLLVLLAERPVRLLSQLQVAHA